MSLGASALLARERRLRVCCVPYEEAGGARGHAALFGEYTHAEYLSERCGGDLHAYHNEVGRWYPDGEIYRPDLLPVPSYVLRCVRAHRVAGPAALANLLDESFLGDGETSLRTQLRRELQPQCAPEKQGAGDPPLGGDDSPWTEAERARPMREAQSAGAELTKCYTWDSEVSRWSRIL